MQMVSFGNVGLLIRLEDVKLTAKALMVWPYSINESCCVLDGLRVLNLMKLKLFIPSRVPQYLCVSLIFSALGIVLFMDFTQWLLNTKFGSRA